GTIIADDPRLTVKEKYVPNPKHPIRIVLDSRGRLPKEARVLDGSSKTIVYGLKGRPDIPGAEVVRVGGDKKVKVEDAVEDMEKRGMKTLMVEGGGETIWSFFKAGLVDEYHVFVGGRVVGGREAPTPVDGEGFEEAYAIKLMLLEVRKMENGALLSYRVLKK
ncbi:MAG: dihydrofolate reductase family protein, partial [Candidatus Thermoplasmatota archaeon]|nr:dihydrofolate reductase family protein [Candidatus Thermoplasmatota archaeon]